MKIKTVPVQRAKVDLAQLIEEACRGEEIIIVRGKVPVVRLVPLGTASGGRCFGALRGRLIVDDTFFEPLPEAELAAWES